MNFLSVAYINKSRVYLLLVHRNKNWKTSLAQSVPSKTKYLHQIQRG